MAAVTETATPTPKAEFAQLRVLAIEDIDIMREVLCAMLQAVGIGHCMGCATGARGLELLAQTPFDLVFCDLTMAPMDGLEFLRRLRADPDPRLANLPVVMLTGRTEPSCRISALGAGASAFAIKPVPLSALQDLVRLALRESAGR